MYRKEEGGGVKQRWLRMLLVMETRRERIGRMETDTCPYPLHPFHPCFPMLLNKEPTAEVCDATQAS